MWSKKIGRFNIVFLLFVVFVGTAAAETNRSYAVLSLIGDKLEVVTAVPTIGSNRDTNQRKEVALNDPAFDIQALKSADEAIAKFDPQAKVTLMRSNGNRLFDLQEKILVADKDGKELLGEVLALAKNSQVKQVILIAKHRAEANLKMNDGHIGRGLLKGLGLYVDNYYEMVIRGEAEIGVGFLAPYCYIKAFLIDAETGAVLRSESYGEGTVRSVLLAKDSLDPMDALTPKQKFEMLEKMVQQNVSKLVATLLAAQK
jgi:hypothetical protein